MAVTAESLEAKIRSGLEGVQFVQAVDESGGCGAKFSITVVAMAFEGKPIVMQHRLCHKCLEEEIKSIHALSLRTIAPSAWTAEKEASLTSDEH